MTLEQLRTFVGALVAASAIAASCSRHHAADETTIAGRRLGESTASPGDDPDRPLAVSVDTHEVSATISRAPARPAPQEPQPGATGAGSGSALGDNATAIGTGISGGSSGTASGEATMGNSPPPPTATPDAGVPGVFSPPPDSGT